MEGDFRTIYTSQREEDSFEGKRSMFVHRYASSQSNCTPQKRLLCRSIPREMNQRWWWGLHGQGHRSCCCWWPPGPLIELPEPHGMVYSWERRQGIVLRQQTPAEVFPGGRKRPGTWRRPSRGSRWGADPTLHVEQVNDRLVTP